MPGNPAHANLESGGAQLTRHCVSCVIIGPMQPEHLSRATVHLPRISIIMPAYNGERYIPEDFYAHATVRHLADLLARTER